MHYLPVWNLELLPKLRQSWTASMWCSEKFSKEWRWAESIQRKSLILILFEMYSGVRFCFRDSCVHIHCKDRSVFPFVTSISNSSLTPFSTLILIGFGSTTKGADSAITDTWFAKQKEFYVSAGKAFGDQVSALIAFLLSNNLKTTFEIVFHSEPSTDAGNYCEGKSDEL